MYDVHLGLIRKRVVDFPLVLIEVFSLSVTAESLRLTSEEIKNQRFRSNVVILIQNFRYMGSPPPILFARSVRPMNALQLHH